MPTSRSAIQEIEDRRNSALAPFASSLPTALLAAVLCLGLPSPVQAQGKRIENDHEKCRANAGPAIRVTVSGIRSATGTVRVQSYRATASDWLQRGRWLHRIDVPARQSSMSFCVPVEEPGTYGVAVLHDVNGNGATDILRDGGGISNNPAVNIFNLGRPSHKKAAFAVSNGVTPIRVQMQYR